MQNQINLSGKQIIKADYDTISNFINTMIGLLVLLVLVFMSGYLFIYNNIVHFCKSGYTVFWPA